MNQLRSSYFKIKRDGDDGDSDSGFWRFTLGEHFVASGRVACTQAAIIFAGFNLYARARARTSSQFRALVCVCMIVCRLIRCRHRVCSRRCALGFLG